jgi:hypothetical protein
MNRRHVMGLLFALLATAFFQSPATAANVWLSLNLQFNTPNDVNSGGTWTAVAKAEPQGLAGVSLNIANATTFGSFLAPPQLDVRMQSAFGSVRNVAVGDDLVPPYPLGIGVVGSSFPSTYVDPAGLAPFGGYPNYGSFTGGVALATGTFSPGVVPDWAILGFNASDANLFTGPSPAPVADADTLLTVRSLPVPEPTVLALIATGMVGLAAMRRRTH